MVCLVRASLDRDAVDLFKTGDACLDLLEARSAQVPHAFLRRLIGNVHSAATCENDAPDGLGDGHHLVDADAALVPVRAVRAPLRGEELQACRDIGLRKTLFEQGLLGDIERLLAMIAESSGESLRDDEADGRRDSVRLHAHIDEPRERLWRIVGVQGRENQVTGLGRLDGDLGGLEIANLTDHDDVRILAQERAHRGGERQADLGIDIDLVDAGEIDFRRVLGRGDIRVLAVEDLQSRVQRDGLAAARRPRHQDHALRLREVLEVQLLLEGLVAERVDPKRRLRGIEDAHHDLLAEERRAGAHAEVDRPVLRQLHLDAPILRHTPLGDVEARHHLQTRGELPRELYRGLSDILQHPVHAVADAIALLVGLEVDVRGALADRIEHDLVDEADDRRVLDVIAGDLLAILVPAADLERLEIDAFLLREGRHLSVRLLDGLVDGLLQLVVLDDDCIDPEPCLELDLVDRMEVRGVGYREEEPFPSLEEWQDAVLGEQLVADQLDRIEIEVDRIEIEERNAELRRGSDRDVAGAGRATRHELRDDVRLALAGGVERFQHGRLVDEPVLNEALR